MYPLNWLILLLRASLPRVPTVLSKVPFGPQVMSLGPTDGEATDSDSPNYIQGTPNREPLEREVSDALRRISAYSDGSVYSQYPGLSKRVT